MAYRLRYTVNVDWIGPGQGPMAGTGPLSGVAGGSGNAQTLRLANTNNYAATSINGTGTGGAIAAADITALTNAMAADVAAQMNASPALGQLQGFATGGG